MHSIKTKITWDPVKAKQNRLKHRVFFSEVESVFYDPNAISVEDKNAESEARYVTIGLDSLVRVVVVVYTYRDDEIRVISARKATKAEQRIYEKGI